MIQRTLFPEPYRPVPDEVVVETLRAAIARAGRLPRSVDLLLFGLGVAYLIDELHGAGLAIVRVSPGQGQ